MVNQTIPETFQKALLEYEGVISELNRPQRDVVMVAACEMIKKSVGDFLTAYLQTKGQSVDTGTSLVQLYNESLKTDRRFNQLDIETITCLEDEHADTCQRCLQNGWIHKCEEVMVNTKELVLKLMHEK